MSRVKVIFQGQLLKLRFKEKF